MSIRRTKGIHTSPARPPNYLSRRVQQRLLVMVGMLLLVMILMSQARQPGNWAWMWRIAGQTPPASARGPSPAIVLASAESTRSGWPPGLDSDLLGEVRDDSYFLPVEQTAWFALWSVLKDTPDDELRELSLGRVSYLQVYRQTSAYRGRVVDLKGTVRRAHRVSAPSNEIGIEDYVQCWLFPDDGPREPIVLYVLDAPSTLRDGMDMSLPIELTGIVYKRWSYQVTDGLKVAPVVLAKQIRPLRESTAPTPLEREETGLGTHPIAVVLAIAATSMLVVLFLFRHSARRAQDPRRSEALPVTVSAPEDYSTRDPSARATDIETSPEIHRNGGDST